MHNNNARKNQMKKKLELRHTSTDNLFEFYRKHFTMLLEREILNSILIIMFQKLLPNCYNTESHVRIHLNKKLNFISIAQT